MPAPTFKRLTAEAPLLLTIGVASLLMATIIRFVIIPGYLNIYTLQKENKHYQELISSESGYTAIKQEITGKIDTLTKRITPVEDRKETTTDLSGFLETLIAVGRKADIRFVRMQPQEESVTKDFRLNPVMLALTTTYHELGQFITELEKLPHLFRVERLALSASKTGKCDVNLLITCLIPLEQNNE
jgi:Tfp pilus assembly protein PilO